MMRRTSKRRMVAALKAVRHKLLKRRHVQIPGQGLWIRRFLQGYFGYYAVRTNLRILRSFRTQVIRAWSNPSS